MALNVPKVQELSLSDMSTTFDSLRLVIRTSQVQYGGDFADSSPARRDWQSCAAPMDRDLQNAYLVGLSHWHSILDHAHGLSNSIQAGLTHSAITLSRVIAETVARSWFLLTEGIDQTERIRRLINERLYSGHEDQRLLEGLLPSEDHPAGVQLVAQAMQPVMHERIARVLAERDELLESAEKYGFLPIEQRSDRKHTPHVGESRPSDQKIIGLTVDSIPQAASFHRMSSAVIHASTHAQKRLLAEHLRPDGRYESRPIPMSGNDLAATTWLVVSSIASVAGVLFRQAGWDTTGLDVAVARLVLAWSPPDDAALIAELQATTMSSP